MDSALDSALELWVATGNQGKLNEFVSLFKDKGIKICSPNDLDSYYPPEETGKTFSDNAKIKAQSLRSLVSDKWIVAEDSGLEVEGLNNMPGIFSARYAGDNASDRENNAKVLKMVSIRTATNRKAQFLCSMFIISPDGEEHIIEETVSGSISKAERGTEGFGYDTCFIPDGEEKTFAELGMSFKNKVSHRAKAIKKIAELIC